MRGERLSQGRPHFDLSGELDPELVRRVASDEALHALAPLVYARARAQPDAMPADALETLRIVDATNRFFCTLRHEELTRRVQAFEAESIQSIPLKGTSLAMRLYGDVGGRRIGTDIDLLVRREDAAKATAILERDGYRSTAPAARYDRPFVRVEPDASTTTVELHTELLPRWFRADAFTSAAWSRASVSPAPEFPAFTLDPIDEVLHLCTHLVKDQIEIAPSHPQLRHALDLHLVLERWGPGTDWSELRRRARDHGLHAHAPLAFEFAVRQLGGAVPDELVEELPPWKRAFFERRVWNVDRPAAWRLPYSKQLRLLALALLLDDGWRARAGHLRWAVSELFESRRSTSEGASPGAG